MPSNSKRWAEIERLLDRVLDQREAREQQRVAKIIRLRAWHSDQPTGATPPAASAMPPPKQRRKGR